MPSLTIFHWLLFDWFGYGGLHPNTDPVRPAPYAEVPFQRIIGRSLPAQAEAITPDDSLHYKRTVLAEQFYRLRADVLEWLLAIRRPDQRVMTTITGRQEAGECDPHSWRRWFAAGCDFFGNAWGAPPDFRPHPRYAGELEIVRAAFREMAALG
jgi:hypothetical protein